MSKLLRTSLVAALLAASACDGPTDPPRAPGPPTRIVRVSEPSTATPLQVIPVAVRVTDRRGAPVPGAVIRWIAADGSGVTATPPGHTDDDGQARADWYIGAAEKQYSMSAHLMEGEGSTARTIAVTTFTVTATAPPP